MISFTILSILAIAFIVVALITLVVGGASTVIVFGDVIVCGLIIYWLVKKIIQRRRG